MQWVLQRFEDTEKLADALDRLGLSYSWHKVVPFIGDLLPEPEIADPEAVILFGSYALRHYAERHGLRPGVFTIAPFAHEAAWQPFLLNGPGAQFLALGDVPAGLEADDRDWFMRPVDDSKAEPGRVRTGEEIVSLARKVLVLDEADIPVGSLRPDTALMLCEPVRILTEWRLWVVEGEIVAYSLYREGRNVVYRREIDDDTLAFGRRMVRTNPDYARAYVLDVCRTVDGLHLLETNCINAAGFYAADLVRLAASIEGMALST